MRLKICSRIPPVILAGLIITLVVINKSRTEKEEVTSMEERVAQTQSNSNLFEQSQRINDGKGEEEVDDTLQKVKEDFKQHMKTLQKQTDMETEKDVGIDVLENSQDIPLKRQEDFAQIKGDIESKKEKLVQNKEPTIQEQPSMQKDASVIQDNKVEPRQTEVKSANDQVLVPVKPSGSENKKDLIIEYKKAVDIDVELQDSHKKFSGIVTLAQNVLRSATNPKILLLSFVHEDNAVFANNWLCNTKVLDLHSSLIIVTYGSESKELLSEKWPLLNMYSIEPDTPEEKLRGTPLTLTKLQIIYVLLNAGINILLLDVESVWFSNPVPSFKSGGADMMVNIASSVHVNTGFIVLFATEKNKYFWGSLYLKVKAFEKRRDVGIEDQYDKFLKKMTVQRFGDISFIELPKESYMEGVWYELSSEERQKTRPIVVRNNNLLGFAKRIRRAVTWKHWFVVEEGKCDVDRVSKIVKTHPKV